jgi:iron complex transport system ATP-binding protein
MASHELNVCGAYADRLMLLSEGKTAAVGTPDEVLRPEVLEPVYGVGIQRFEGENAVPVVVPTRR